MGKRGCVDDVLDCVAVVSLLLVEKMLLGVGCPHIVGWAQKFPIVHFLDGLTAQKHHFCAENRTAGIHEYCLTLGAIVKNKSFLHIYNSLYNEID